MKPIPTVLGTAGVIAVSVFALVVFAGNTRSATAKPTAVSAADRVERGRHLVHRVVLCIDCHSPRNERGEHIESQHLTGSPIPFQPTVAMPWAPSAPRLAGLPAGYTEAQLEHFLITGERPHGLPPTLPPMPPYRLDRDDAQAVVAYLRSLGSETR